MVDVEVVLHWSSSEPMIQDIRALGRYLTLLQVNDVAESSATLTLLVPVELNGGHLAVLDGKRKEDPKLYTTVSYRKEMYLLQWQVLLRSSCLTKGPDTELNHC